MYPKSFTPMASHPITHIFSASTQRMKNSLPYHGDTCASQLSCSQIMLYARYKTTYLKHEVVATSITTHSIVDFHYKAARWVWSNACFLLMPMWLLDYWGLTHSKQSMFTCSTLQTLSTLKDITHAFVSMTQDSWFLFVDFHSLSSAILYYWRRFISFLMWYFYILNMDLWLSWKNLKLSNFFY